MIHWYHYLDGLESSQTSCVLFVPTRALEFATKKHEPFNQQNIISPIQRKIFSQNKKHQETWEINLNKNQRLSVFSDENWFQQPKICRIPRMSLKEERHSWWFVAEGDVPYLRRRFDSHEFGFPFLVGRLFCQ